MSDIGGWCNIGVDYLSGYYCHRGIAHLNVLPHITCIHNICSVKTKLHINILLIIMLCIEMFSFRYAMIIL